MKKVLLSLVFSVLVLSGSLAWAETVAERLQNISVTVKSDAGQGSGVLVTRKMKINGKEENVTFCLTAGHVIDTLRTVREVIRDGSSKKLVEFKDVDLIQHWTEDGRKVGEFKVKAKVILYSDSEYGEDLALLWVRKKNFTTDGAKFYLENERIVPVSTRVIHIGSLFGEDFSNSYMEGHVSAVGRTFELGGANVKTFTQIFVGATPGSSGGGVFTTDSRLMGLLVRGGGPSLGLTVPMDRIYNWAKDSKVEWLVDENLPVPQLEDVLKLPIE